MQSLLIKALTMINSKALCRDQELLSQYELTVSKYPVVENLYGVMEKLETWNC